MSGTEDDMGGLRERLDRNVRSKARLVEICKGINCDSLEGCPLPIAA